MVKLTDNASLLPYNTFGMHVHAALLVQYDTTDELQAVLSSARVRQLMQDELSHGRLPFWHIGAGSNLLFRGDYPGVVLHCNAKGIRIACDADGRPRDNEGDSEACYLDVDAGTVWDDVCGYCASQGLYGPENLSAIPGEAGAAAVQNIGAYGVELSDLVESVTCWDVEQGCLKVFSQTEMHYGYRESLLKHAEAKSRYIVCKVTLRTLRHGELKLSYAGLKAALPEHPTVQDVRNAVISIRANKLPDPKVLGNAGSFFKNPIVSHEKFAELLASYPDMPHYIIDAQHVKVPAGWLIEQCGWKGRSLGQAGVYERQSLVLVNRGNASPDEVVKLCQTIIDDVAQKFGIRIEPEVNII